MKHLSLACAVVTAFVGVATAAVATDTTGIAQAVKAGVQHYAAQDEVDYPEWLSRVEADVRFGTGSPEWSVLTVQPLYQSEDKVNTFFTQLSALRYTDFGDTRTVNNVGLGYRELLLGNSLMLGANAFFDHEWENSHQRASFGVEARSNPIEFNANYYEALSGVKNISAAITERALDGYDAELGVQVPYLPWAKLFAKTYEWTGEVGSDTVGQVYSARLQPASWLELEAGHDSNHRLGGDNFARVNVKFALGERARPPAIWVDSKPFAFDQTMEDKTLEKVRRTNKIVVERTTAVGGGGGALTVSVSRGS